MGGVHYRRFLYLESCIMLQYVTVPVPFRRLGRLASLFKNMRGGYIKMM